METQDMLKKIHGLSNTSPARTELHPAPVPTFLSFHQRQAAFQPVGQKAGEAKRGNESQEAEESICNETFIDVQVSVLKECELLSLARLPAAAQPQPSPGR